MLLRILKAARNLPSLFYLFLAVLGGGELPVGQACAFHAPVKCQAHCIYPIGVWSRLD